MTFLENLGLWRASLQWIAAWSENKRGTDTELIRLSSDRDITRSKVLQLICVGLFTNCIRFDVVRISLRRFASGSSRSFMCTLKSPTISSLHITDVVNDDTYSANSSKNTFVYHLGIRYKTISVVYLTGLGRLAVKTRTWHWQRTETKGIWEDLRNTKRKFGMRFIPITFWQPNATHFKNYI